MSNTIVHHFIRTTPSITRILVALTILISSCIYFDFIKPQSISYSRYYLFDFQFYRMFTTFFYYGKVSFELIMNFIFLYRYSSMLEESYIRKSDYFFSLLLICISLIICGSVIYIPFLATPLSNTLTYIWSRKNPQGIVQIFGFISFSAFYLPFIFPLISFVFEGRIPKEEVVGILVGHIVYYLQDVYPKFGKNYFKTPCFLHKIFKEKCDECIKVRNNKMKRKVGDFKSDVEVRTNDIQDLCKEIIAEEILNEKIDETMAEVIAKDALLEDDVIIPECTAAELEAMISDELIVENELDSDDAMVPECTTEELREMIPDELMVENDFGTESEDNFQTLSLSISSEDEKNIIELDVEDKEKIIRAVKEVPIDFKSDKFDNLVEIKDDSELEDDFEDLPEEEIDYEDLIDEANEFGDDDFEYVSFEINEDDSGEVEEDVTGSDDVMNSPDSDLRGSADALFINRARNVSTIYGSSEEEFNGPDGYDITGNGEIKDEIENVAGNSEAKGEINVEAKEEINSASSEDINSVSSEDISVKQANKKQAKDLHPLEVNLDEKLKDSKKNEALDEDDYNSWNSE